MLHQMRGLGWAIAQSSAVVIGLAIGLMDGAVAQIVPDTTLGTEGSRVRNFGAADAIAGGVRRGANLFHSFREFNVGAGRAAYFLNPSNDIRHILARVTGNNRSEILGTLGILNLNGVTSNPNLFLINPNGIIFGLNARLDVGASFVGTTANAIEFGDRGWFSATNPEVPPLLTVQPSTFLFNQIPTGSIVSNAIAPSRSGSSFLGLRVPNHENLTLLGGNVRIDGNGVAKNAQAGLHAFGGRITIGAVGGLGTIGLNPNGSLNFPDSVERADVFFTNRALVDDSLDGIGEIGVIAQNIDVLNGSRLQAGIDLASESTTSQPGNLTLNATSNIQVRQISHLSSNVSRSAIGSGGDIIIRAGSLKLADQSSLSTSILGQGNAGNIFIRVNGSLKLANQSSLSANTFGQGNAGNIFMRVNGSILLVDSNISSNLSIDSIGKGGNISIQADSLTLNDSIIDTSTTGKGNAGNILLRISGLLSLSRSFISSGVLEPTSIGQGGAINIRAGSLILQRVSQITSGTSGRGNAGSILAQINRAIS